jgi:hypothetical protein
MLTTKNISAVGLLLVLLSFPPRSYASARVLSAQELDEVQAGDLSSVMNENFLNDLLALTQQTQTSLHAINNITAVNSTVIVQTNILFAINPSGDIVQKNLAK